MVTYELPLSSTYVRHWGVVEAVRELIQNAIDSDSPFEYELDAAAGSLTLISRHSTLEPSSLVLGVTSKAEDSSKIGSFGEGFKIALLVLCREGVSVVVRNGGRDWTPSFEFSEKFNVELLCIREETTWRPDVGLRFELSGVGIETLDRVVASCLHMQTRIGQHIETSFGRILFERAGLLYVNGLFVCDTQMKLGYDIKPEFLQLDRDRQTVSSYDLKDTTKNLWLETKLFSEIYEMLEEGCEDVEFVKYSQDAAVKQAFLDEFQKRHPTAVLAANQEQMVEIQQKGREVHISSSLTTLLENYPPYQTEVYRRPQRFSDYEWRVAMRKAATDLGLTHSDVSDPEELLERLLSVKRDQLVSRMLDILKTYRGRFRSNLTKTLHALVSRAAKGVQ